MCAHMRRRGRDDDALTAAGRRVASLSFQRRVRAFERRRRRRRFFTFTTAPAHVQIRLHLCSLLKRKRVARDSCAHFKHTRTHTRSHTRTQTPYNSAPTCAVMEWRSIAFGGLGFGTLTFTREFCIDIIYPMLCDLSTNSVILFIEI